MYAQEQEAQEGRKCSPMFLVPAFELCRVSHRKWTRGLKRNALLYANGTNCRLLTAMWASKLDDGKPAHGQRSEKSRVADVQVSPQLFVNDLCGCCCCKCVVMSTKHEISCYPLSPAPRRWDYAWETQGPAH